jgi:hypothetical protein
MQMDLEYDIALEPIHTIDHYKYSRATVVK